jgi:predicted DNA-binding transcriptional regulator AlpA
MALIHRINKQDLADYQARRITARTISEKYGVTLSYVYQCIERQPKQQPRPSKSQLRKVRWEHRNAIAKQVPPLSPKEAAKMCHCSERTMWRHIQRVRGAKP